MKKKGNFEHSGELKRVFNELSDKWCKKNRLGLADLAERCGVTLQYLSHIGRYGRIPSKPILTLLAFNLDVAQPEDLFRMAGMNDPWPYESGMGLRQRPATESGLLSVSLDMNGFAAVIKEIVRAEVQPKRLDDLLGRRPLRVGLNRGQFFLFEKKSRDSHEGFFPELMRSLALSLRCEVEFVDIVHSEFPKKLSNGAIDCFGPVYRTAPRLAHALFSKPFCSVPVAGLGRGKKASSLPSLPHPKKISELRKKDYIVAVHRDSMAHHFAETELGIPSERIIPCDLPEEALERVLLTNLPRPAHLMLTDTPFARRAAEDHGAGLETLFDERASDSAHYEDTIAVRQDWPALLAVIDQAIEFLKKGGAIERLFERTVGQDKEDYSIAV